MLRIDDIPQQVAGEIHAFGVMGAETYKAGKAHFLEPPSTHFEGRIFTVFVKVLLLFLENPEDVWYTENTKPNPHCNV